MLGGYRFVVQGTTTIAVIDGTTIAVIDGATIAVIDGAMVAITEENLTIFDSEYSKNASSIPRFS